MIDANDTHVEPGMIKLGVHMIPMYPQRHAYLTNRVQAFIRSLVGMDFGGTNSDDVAGLLDLLGDKAYDLLSIAVPTYGNKCPKYEFMGYGSQAAYEAKEYDPRDDKSPDFPQILDALDAAVKSNRFDVVKAVGKVVDPKLLKSWVNTKLAVAISTVSANSPAPTGGSEESTNFGATSPISTVNGDSPLDASKP